MAQLSEHPFDPYAALQMMMVDQTTCGALASFIGLVRASFGQVTALRLDHYPVFTQRALDQIEVDGKARFDVIDTIVIHRIGLVKPGDPIVLVGATSLHRKEALACVDYVMDRLKTEAPFWKMEIGPDASRWIEPRDTDYQARQNWDR